MKERSTRPQAVLSRNLAVAGLFELFLAGKRFEEISISEICETAGISRQTFYRNFDTKEDIILYYVDEKVKQHMRNVVGIMEQDVEGFFGHLPFSNELLSYLMENNLMYLLRDSVLPLIDTFMQTNAYRLLLGDHKYDPYMAHYLADTMVSILETWTLNDFAETPEELNRIMQGFMSGVGRPPQTE